MNEYKIVFSEGRGYTVETKHERGGYQYSPYFKNEGEAQKLLEELKEKDLHEQKDRPSSTSK